MSKQNFYQCPKCGRFYESLRYCTEHENDANINMSEWKSFECEVKVLKEIERKTFLAVKNCLWSWVLF